MISNAPRISHLDGHFVLGEGSAPEQLVDAVDGEESCDVGTQVVGHCHPHGMGGNHLHARRNKTGLRTVFFLNIVN